MRKVRKLERERERRFIFGNRCLKLCFNLPAAANVLAPKLERERERERERKCRQQYSDSCTNYDVC